RQVGELTLALARRHVDRVVTVSEEELANAILLLLEIEKTVVEGAGAAPLAALLNRALGLAGLNVVLVLSGGNIDVTVISRIIERGLVKDGRLVRLGVLLRDQPGALARLTTLIAAERANILHIEHDRAFSSGGIGETEVELTLETSGRAQAVGTTRPAIPARCCRRDRSPGAPGPRRSGAIRSGSAPARPRLGWGRARRGT